MRLPTKDIEHIIYVLNANLTLSNAELRLFGNRVNDKPKGGDIDLLLVLPNENVYQQAFENKLDILVELKQKLGDQKIDLVLTTFDLIPTDPFLDMIYDMSIVLDKWT